MTAGCPPVVSDIPAFMEFIEDGKNGFIVDFAASSAAANRIHELLDTDQSDLSLAGKETAANYGWDKIIEDVEVVYRKIAADLLNFKRHSTLIFSG